MRLPRCVGMMIGSQVIDALEGKLMKQDRLNEERWQAVQSRDPSADGLFFYGVISTGVYCHPSCPSRAPRRDNLRIFTTAAEARAEGYRACQRCRPEQGTPAEQSAHLVEVACRLLAAQEPATVAAVAVELDIGRERLVRLFRNVTGLKPKQWQLAHRRHQVAQSTLDAERVSEAVFNAGYGSATRFYADTQSALAMTPTAIRGGAEGELLRYALADCPLGRLLVAWSDKGLCAIEFAPEGSGSEDERLQAQLHKRYARAQLVRDDGAGVDLVQSVVACVEEPRAARHLPLDLRGTAFQQRVWRALLEIPVGETVSYSELAQGMGAPRSSRAVATACASNTLAIVVPCHRVVRADGSLSGYRWGVERKALLLACERERVDSKAS